MHKCINTAGQVLEVTFRHLSLLKLANSRDPNIHMAIETLVDRFEHALEQVCVCVRDLCMYVCMYVQETKSIFVCVCMRAYFNIYMAIATLVDRFEHALQQVCMCVYICV